MRLLKPIHVSTPIWKSRSITAAMGAPVFLKMEAFQPTGSFKVRGIGATCQASCRAGATRLVCASGGNAGYATAFAGHQLGLEVTVIVPKTTPAWMQNLIRQEGANILVSGDSWDDSHAFAVALARDVGAAYIHPFDDPRIWRGHATLIHEIAETAPKPGAIVVAVGGGGLLCGVLEGLHQVGWKDVPVLAVETEGAASLAKSVTAGYLVTLDEIATIATCLGARTVAAETLVWTQKHDVIPWVVSDRDALDACLRFANEHRVLVEPACGAALSAVYGRAKPLEGLKPVMTIVCGGAGVNLELLEHWQRIVPA